MSSVQINRTTNGYIFTIGGNPILQLHLYGGYPNPIRYYTLFWLGRADVSGLRDCFREAVEELSESFHIQPDQFDRSKVLYGRNRGLVSMPYHIWGHSYTRQTRSEINHHENFLTQNLLVLTFARFDVEGSVPIILWGDLKGPRQQTEVGFSAAKIPAAVTKYFRHSCFRKIADDDFLDINQELGRLAPSLI